MSGLSFTKMRAIRDAAESGGLIRVGQGFLHIHPRRDRVYQSNTVTSLVAAGLLTWRRTDEGERLVATRAGIEALPPGWRAQLVVHNNSSWGVTQDAART